MKLILTYDDVRAKITNHLPQIYSLGIERVGVFKYPIRQDHPIELYAVCDPYSRDCKYFAFLDIVESLFLDYKVNVSTKEDIEPLYYETVLCDVLFCDANNYWLKYNNFNY